MAQSGEVMVVMAIMVGENRLYWYITTYPFLSSNRMFKILDTWNFDVLNRLKYKSNPKSRRVYRGATDKMAVYSSPSNKSTALLIAFEIFAPLLNWIFPLIQMACLSTHHIYSVTPLYIFLAKNIWQSIVKIHGISNWSVTSKSALNGRRIHNYIELWCIVGSLGVDFWVSSTSFQTSNIGWPQQPPTEWVSNINEKFGIGHLGASDDPTIMLSKFFDEMRLSRSLRPLRLLRL